MMKIAIIGSRNYTNKTQIKNFMFRLKMEHQGVEVVSGGAKDGADKYAKRYALEFGLPYSEFPPQHDPHNIHFSTNQLSQLVFLLLQLKN